MGIFFIYTFFVPFLYSFLILGYRFVVVFFFLVFRLRYIIVFVFFISFFDFLKFDIFLQFILEFLFYLFNFVSFFSPLLSILNKMSLEIFYFVPFFKLTFLHSYINYPNFYNVFIDFYTLAF